MADKRRNQLELAHAAVKKISLHLLKKKLQLTKHVQQIYRKAFMNQLTN